MIESDVKRYTKEDWEMSTLRGETNRILADIQAGKEDSKEKLFELTYNHLKIIARIYAYDKNDMEDILQIAYLKVFKHIKSFDLSKDGYNWLCKIVQNVAYTLRRTTPTCVSLDDYSHHADSSDVMNYILAKDEMYRYLENYSEKDRQLIHLRFYEGYCYSEIAEKMSMKKSNVHRRISKIVKEILKNK